MSQAEFIWMNGILVPWAGARVHVMSHGLHYGTSVFEGIRCYETPKGPAAFRLGDHVRRLFESARIYGFPMPYGEDEIFAGCLQVLQFNRLTAAYLRPIAWLGECGLAVSPEPELLKVDVAIAAFPWGAYLGEDAAANGVDVCVSSWQRVAPNTIPAGAKAGGGYLSSYLIGREARGRGLAEGIGLGTDGRLSEGAGENLFLVRGGKIFTPPAAASILVGLTRDTVLTLAGDLGIEVIEQPLPREMLYVADEVFMTGTAAEITPVRSVDGAQVGLGRLGPVTRSLQAAFQGLFSGATPDTHGWLTPTEDLSLDMFSATPGKA